MLRLRSRLRRWLGGSSGEILEELGERDLEMGEDNLGAAEAMAERGAPPPVPAEALPSESAVPVAVPVPGLGIEDPSWDDVLARARAQIPAAAASPQPQSEAPAAAPRRRSATGETRLAELMASARHAGATRSGARRRRRTTSSVALACTPPTELTPPPQPTEPSSARTGNR